MDNRRVKEGTIELIIGATPRNPVLAGLPLHIILVQLTGLPQNSNVFSNQRPNQWDTKTSGHLSAAIMGAFRQKYFFGGILSQRS